LPIIVLVAPESHCKALTVAEHEDRNAAATPADSEALDTDRGIGGASIGGRGGRCCICACGGALLPFVIVLVVSISKALCNNMIKCLCMSSAASVTALDRCSINRLELGHHIHTSAHL